MQKELDIASKNHQKKLEELENLRAQKKNLQRQKVHLENKQDSVGEDYLNITFDEDDRLRIIKHSKKARNTLGKFRTSVVKNHVHSIENLMLESFQNLLRKTDLVHQLNIEPTTFKTKLTDKNGNLLPFDRLSAAKFPFTPKGLKSTNIKCESVPPE